MNLKLVILIIWLLPLSIACRHIHGWDAVALAVSVLLIDILSYIDGWISKGKSLGNSRTKIE